MVFGHILQYTQAILTVLLERLLQDGHNMNNKEKIDIIEGRLINLNFHINILEEDLKNNPDQDVPGKIPRSDILINLKYKKEAIESEKKQLLETM
jgi:hypothetical protein